MRLTMNILLQAVIDAVAGCVPEAEHYRGRIEEGFSRPAFLYIPVFQGEKKHNYVSSEKDVEVQVIYFGRTDRYNREDFGERLLVQDKLDGFLNQFHLKAGDRTLHFTYETKDADGQMAFYLSFRFLDESFDERLIRDMGCDMMEHHRERLKMDV